MIVLNVLKNSENNLKMTHCKGDAPQQKKQENIKLVQNLIEEDSRITIEEAANQGNLARFSI